MPEPLGYTFAPSFDQAEQGRRGGSPALQAQTPLQTLSFRLPKFKGAGGGLSPLQGTQGVGSSIASAVLTSVLQTVFGPPSATPSAVPGILTPPSAVMPSKVPVPGATPTATDTGQIGTAVHGPSGPTVTPSPFQPTGPDGGLGPIDLDASRRPPVIMPGDNARPGKEDEGIISISDPESSLLGPPSFGPSTFTEPKPGKDYWSDVLEHGGAGLY